MNINILFIGIKLCFFFSFWHVDLVNILKISYRYLKHQKTNLLNELNLKRK